MRRAKPPNGPGTPPKQPCPPSAAQAKELQQLLGDHHDSVVARTVLLDLAQEARAAGEDTFTYGLMYQRQACQAAEIEQALV